MEPVPRPTLRVFVVSDVRFYREGLGHVLGSTEYIVVLGSAGGTDEGLRLVAELKPDVVLLDTAMADGVWMAQRLADTTPDAKIVALAVPQAEEDLIALVEAGVLGYVTREQSLDELVAAIISVVREEAACSPMMRTLVVKRVRELAAEFRPGARAHLTRRQREILDLIAQGLSNKEIARELNIERATVKNHIHSILEKLQVQTRAAAVAQVRLWDGPSGSTPMAARLPQKVLVPESGRPSPADWTAKRSIGPFRHTRRPRRIVVPWGRSVQDSIACSSGLSSGLLWSPRSGSSSRSGGFRAARRRTLPRSPRPPAGISASPSAEWGGSSRQEPPARLLCPRAPPGARVRHRPKHRRDRPAGGTSSAPVDAVFPQVAGRLSKFLVAPGKHVAAGEALALLDDGGTAAGAVLQAQNELATAQLELRQKRTSDPLNGLPPTPEELAAGEMAVVLGAEAAWRSCSGPSTPADVSAARSDLRRAEADLEALLGGTPAERAAVISMAHTNVQVAQQRLDALLALPSPDDVAAAELDLRRAEADLADLLRADPPPSPEALAAARQAVVAARLKLAKVLGSGRPRRRDGCPPRAPAVAGRPAEAPGGPEPPSAGSRPPGRRRRTSEAGTAARAAAHRPTSPPRDSTSDALKPTSPCSVPAVGPPRASTSASPGSRSKRRRHDTRSLGSQHAS